MSCFLKNICSIGEVTHPPNDDVNSSMFSSKYSKHKGLFRRIWYADSLMMWQLLFLMNLIYAKQLIHAQ